MDSPHLNAREKAAVLWAEHVTKNTARSRDDVFDEVRKVFDESEIVELTFVSAYFNLRNRFNDSLQVPLEPLADANPTKQKPARVNTEKLKDFFRYVLENWPEDFPEPNPDN